ncbi:PEP-CTERM sorting domain-containing protein [Roseateles sp. LYH14W]|uniref:PEP-CTERM sorting domain-containing protein n=1 Tax=Pelomonas parva TaxID=3299032 RepID=A0ABW7F9L8_9BURK
MHKQLTALALAALAALPAHAAVSLIATDLDYSETFDTLASATSSTNIAWANDSTLAGWSLFNRPNGTAAPTYRGDDGNSNTGHFFSYGSTGNSDRALGSIGSGGAASYWGTVANGATAGYIALALQNNTGKTIDSFKLSYDGEQWRNGGNATAQAMTVQYGFGASFADVADWGDLSSLTFTSPVASTTSDDLNGNLAANRAPGLTQTVESLTWANGSTLWVRWAEVNNAGNDHGLAIDNVAFTATVSAVPEPQTYALMLGGLGLVGWMARRRKA